MELIDGVTVKEKVQGGGPFNSRDALGLILQIASALSAAERQQLVHRDLKPANWMLTEENGEQVVKIIDFGLAKQYFCHRAKFLAHSPSPADSSAPLNLPVRNRSGKVIWMLGLISILWAQHFFSC